MATVGDDVDLGPWAAYTVGHHPYALMVRHMNSWTLLQDSLAQYEPAYQHEDPPELTELDEALGVLASQGRVDPVCLNRIRGYREEFVLVNKEIGEIAEGTRSESEVVDFDSPLEPGYGALDGMIGASDVLITGSDDLRPWLRLGAAVGEYPLIVTRGIATRWPSLRECYDDLRDLAQKLAKPGEYEFLSEIDHHLGKLDPAAKPPPGDAYTPPFGSQLQAVVDLDGEIRHALRSQAPPEVWVDLDQYRLRFLGSTFIVDRPPANLKLQVFDGRLTKAEAAFLWVLAEHVGEEVSRETIKSEGNQKRHKVYLQYVANFLRDKLRPAIETYRSKREGWLPEHAEECFIVGIRGKYGPYILKLDPRRVRVSPDRPKWMKPA